MGPFVATVIQIVRNTNGSVLGMNDAPLVTQAGIPLHSISKLSRQKKNLDSANLTRFCWVMSKPVPVTPPASYGWEGHRALDMNMIKPQGTLKILNIVGYTIFSRKYILNLLVLS